MGLTREEGLRLVEESRIIAIVRGSAEEEIVKLGRALLDDGIRVMEVTLNTPGALRMIRRLQDELGEQMWIGAGTVLDRDDLLAALDAGASFVVMPNTEETVIAEAAGRQVPIFPGAMTPTEIVRAWKAGATAVKLFSSASLGLNYVKELQGPLSHIPMIAVGGITPQNVGDYLRIGCYAVGVDGSLVSPSATGDYGTVRDRARKLCEAVRAAQT